MRLPFLLLFPFAFITFHSKAQFSYINSSFKDSTGQVKSVYFEEYKVKLVNDSLVQDTTREEPLDRIFGGGDYFYGSGHYLVFNGKRQLLEEYAKYNPDKKTYKYKKAFRYNNEEQLKKGMPSYMLQCDSLGKMVRETKLYLDIRKHPRKVVFLSGDGGSSRYIYKVNKKGKPVKEEEWYRKRDGEWKYQKGTYYTYNEQGKLLKKASYIAPYKEINDSTILLNHYNSAGDIDRQVNLDGARDSTVTIYVYDPSGNLLSIKEGGYVQQFDSLKNLVSLVTPYKSIHSKYEGKNLVEECQYDKDNVLRFCRHLTYKNDTLVKELYLYPDSSTTEYRYDKGDLDMRINTQPTRKMDTIFYNVKNPVPVEDTITTYTNDIYTEKYEFDSHGNWVTKITYTNGAPTYFNRRVITYFR